MRSLAKRALHALRNVLAKPPSLVGPVDEWAVAYTLNPVFVDLTRNPGCGHMYAWGAMQGARLARTLGVDRVSVVELGVAGGRSLISLEKIAERLEGVFGIKIDVYGFDTGTGLPKPQDYRDMPNLWSTGFFTMDEAKLRARLSRAELVLGPVKETMPRFMASNPAPVAFVSFDMDYYSSTIEALELFGRDQRLLLPRVHCYFDDVLGYSFGDHVGERLAIAEFNASHATRKISPIHGLRHFMPPAYSHWLWERYFMLHAFDHSLYGQFDGSTSPTSCGLGG